MESIKVMVVDDSLFSRTLLAETLREGGFDVVGEVESFESLLAVYDQCRPDVVTMDIVMPDVDGFECSRAIFMKDPRAKIILVSSLKDDATVDEARRIGISGYIQKPVDGEILMTMIQNVMSPDKLYEHLIQIGLDTFKEGLTQNISRMSKEAVSFLPGGNFDRSYISLGITAVIGLIGCHSGSFILDMSAETAEKIVESLLKRPHKNREEVQAMVAELANIIAGISCSMLNKEDKSYRLSVSPPSMFSGIGAEITSPNLKIESVTAETLYGNIFIGVGFKKGATLWT